MSNLILDWLNSLNLSRQVVSFGESFKDGYLLGEILHRYNQQSNFDKFSSQSSPLGVTNNFQLLDVSLKRIGIRFTTKIAGEIMVGNEYTIKTLLYELKVCLDQITRNSRQSTNPLLWGTKNDKILSVVGKTRPAFDASRANTFHQSVKGVLENTNAVLMKQAVQKYVDKEQDYYRTISAGESMDLDTQTLHRLRAKDIYKSRKEHEDEFNEAWDSLNLDQWKKNQKRAHDRKMLRQTIEQNIQSQRDAKATKIKSETKSYALRSMENFDHKLETMIITEGDEDNRKSMIRTINS